MPILRRLSSRSKPAEADENVLEGAGDELNVAIPCPLPRTPLNSIPDPSQNPRDGPGCECDYYSFKAEFTSLVKGISGTGTPRSAQSTPTRAGASRISHSHGSRPPLHVALRDKGSSSRAVRGAALDVKSWPAAQAVHFELEEDPSFWEGHNVQVVVRIRPIDTAESALQGYGSCLRQESAKTLTWIGHPDTRFTFDHIACETISQEKLFRVVGVPMVENCMSGYNSCMFAYGQTGSGKTYTMMGEIWERDNNVSEDRGMTPRIFEYLFTRIMEEEMNRKDEKLKYNCKCSFLEIYNEQITDLLDPSSTNLQLREDIKKGVYVENLQEYEVCTVKDIITLLLQGAANRKMAATNMNSESSRSHSLFTCTIESRWEKDAMTHLRFSRLHLVDLAGSERQKSSGAEGERLKEAANINRSLSTLGLVIMNLVDIAHGKHRHVPYRDSRLTFLLQDSLGGNSKTTIIATISPSICSANETLSTLKFAQRAKLIQNNAKVNEDASGDLMALQKQIQKLKEQLSFLANCHHASRPLCCTSNLEIDTDGNLQDNPSCSSMGRSKLNPDIRLKTTYAEATIIGALRREKVADDTVRALEAEIEHMRRLVSQMEDDSVRVKMMVKLREEKIRRLELLADGLMSADNYLTDENYALSEEIKILKIKLDKNPELTRFALENVRLIQQLRKFQDFYHKGEREELLDEISNLRNQLLEIIGKKELQSDIPSSQFSEADMKLPQDRVPCALIEIPAEEFYSTSEELSICREKMASCLAENSKLTREIEDLRHQLKVHFHSLNDSAAYTDDRITLADHSECSGNISILEEYKMGENEVPNSKLLAKCDKMSAKLVDASINHELFYYDQESQMSLLHKVKEIQQETEATKTNFCIKEHFANHQEQVHLMSSCHSYVELNSVACKIEHQENEKRMDSIQQENDRLSQLVFTQETRINALNEDWEKAVGVLAGFLADGYESLENASDQIQRIIDLFPRGKGHVNKHIEQVINVCHEKEKLIHILKMKLEDAQIVGLETTSKLESLRKAAVAMIGVQYLDGDEHANELSHLKAMINEKDSVIQELQYAIPYEEYQMMNTIKRVTSMFIAMKLLFEMEDTQSFLLKHKKSVIDDPAEINCESDIAKPTLDASLIGDHHEVDILMDEVTSLPCEECEISIQKANIKNNEFLLKDVQAEINNAVEKFMESSTFFLALLKDTENLIPISVSDMYHIYCEVCTVVQGIANDGFILKNQLMEVRRNDLNGILHSSSEIIEPKKCVEQCRNLHSIGCIFSKLNKAFINLKAGIGEVTDPSMELPKPEHNVFSQLWSSVTVGDYGASKSKLRENTTEPANLTSKGIINEMELVYSSLMQLFISMAEIFLCNGDEKCSYLLQGQNQAIDILCCHQLNHLNSFEMQHLLDHLEKKIDKTERECSKTANTLQLKLDNAKILAQDKSIQADDLLRKLEEAQKTMEEADIILNALLKLNESAKNETNMWQQKSEDLLAEKACLTAEIHGLMVSNSLIEQQNEILWNQVNESSIDRMDALSSLTVSFQQMREDIERNLKALYHDIFSSGQEMLDFVSTVREWLEQLFVKITDKDSSIACECHGKSSASQLKSTCCEFSSGHGCENESSLIACDNSQDLLGVIDGVLMQTKDTLHMQHLKNESSCSESHKVGSAKTSVDSVIDNCTTSFEAYDTSNMLCSIWKERKQESYDANGMHDFLKNDMGQVDIAIDNSLLKRELDRKDILLQGVLFDFKLLQESASNIRSDKDESERMLTVLNHTQHELASKTAEVNKYLVHQKELECRLAEKEAAHNILLTDLKEARKTLNTLLNENSHLKALIDDAYIKNANVEKELLDKNKVIDSLETEIFSSNSLVEENMLSSVREIEDELKRVKEERDLLLKEAVCLQGKLELMTALADENEAVALEARQVSEAKKIYAEQKEEEVKILECSVEELEETINVLERKVCDMVEEVENHRIKKEQLEQEVCILRHRVLTVESATEILDMSHSESGLKSYMPRKIDNVLSELHQARKQIEDLEVERQKQEEEIKRYKEHILELTVHSEAQSSLYHQKFKMLEAMSNEEKSNHLKCNYAASSINVPEKASVRQRGSSSPFKCIAGLVQQIYSEKDQELSCAKLHIEELEALANSQKKEVCKLTARLAQVDNMTHDVIRDLLEVKLDMTSYANLIDQEQLQILLQDAQQQNQDNYAKGEEMLHLKKQIDILKDERDSWIKEINHIRAEVLAAKIALERGQQRDQFLTAQNEMLKMDKLNLTGKISELDETIKKLVGSRSIEEVMLKENIVMENSSKAHDDRFLNRLSEADWLLTRAKHERAFSRN